jgi:hypothetical protein
MPAMLARGFKVTGGVDDVLAKLIGSLDEIEVDIWSPKLIRVEVTTWA